MGRSSISVLISMAAILVLMISFSASAIAADTYDSLMQSGKAQLKSGKFKSAEQSFRKALELNPDSYDAMIYLGIVLNERKANEAESVLLRALYLNPTDPIVNYQLGMFYFNTSVYDEARDFFEGAEELAPQTELSKKAKEFIERIEKRALRETKPYKFDASLGWQYDTNVVLKSQKGAMPADASRMSDHRAVATVSGDADFYRGKNLKGNAGYAFYQSLHSKLEQYDVQSHMADIKGTYAFEMATVELRYAFDYVFLGGSKYSQSQSISPALIIPEGKGLYTIVTYTYRKNDFKTDNARDGDNNSAGFIQAVPLGESVKLRAGYTYDKESTKVLQKDYTGDKGMIDMTVFLPWDIAANLYQDMHDKEYKGTNPREDKMYQTSVSLRKNLGGTMSLTASHLNIRNDSNKEEFDYVRRITGLTLSAAF